MQTLFTTEEEVQVWVDGRDRAHHDGRHALQQLADAGTLQAQSESLARLWIAAHPPRLDRRLRRPGLLQRSLAPVAGRRAVDGPTLGPFTRPLLGVCVTLVFIVTTAPYWRGQTAFSPQDGGFDTPAAVAARANA